MNDYKVRPVGMVREEENGASIVLDKAFAPALEGLEGFSHLQVLWWFSECDEEAARAMLREQAPYKGGPAWLGSFATRSPRRPNPIALSCVQISYIEKDSGTIGVYYIDAHAGTPVLDIKPYTPSLDRVQHPATPAWCAAWPQSIEESAVFDWDSVFNF